MKKQTRGYVILGILALLVSVTAFAVPAEKTGAFWIAYAFTLAAIAAQIGIWKAAFGKEAGLRSRFLGLPVIHIGVVYLVLQLIVFAVFLFTPAAPAWSAVNSLGIYVLSGGQWRRINSPSFCPNSSTKAAGSADTAE